MNLFTLEHILIAISCFCLAILITKYAENKTHRLWAYFNYVIAAWSAFSSAVGLAHDPKQALFLWKIVIMPAIFIPLAFYHFVCSYCQINRTKTIKLIYAQGLIVIPLIFMNDIFMKQGNLIHNTVYYYKGNLPYYIWMSIWILITSLSFMELWKYARKANKTGRTQTYFIFWASLFGFIGGLSTTLPAFGINFYPTWQIIICFYVILSTYAIFKHRLLPVNIVINKGVVYSLLATLISLIYLTGALVSQKLFNQYLGFSSTLVSSVIIALIFTPLRNSTQYFVDRFFFKGTQFEIAEQNELLKEELTRAEKTKAVALMASSLAHEIRNPMTAIQTFTEHLPQKKNDPAFIDHYTRIVSQEAKRVNDLVQELLDFAKPSEPKFEAVEINGLITDTLHLLNGQISKNKITLENKLSSSPMQIQADPSQLKQALLNIILNAIDAMPHGGTLTVETTSVIPAKAGIQSTQAGIHSPVIPAKARIYTISISDTGTGIDPKDLPHIFEPFYTKKKGGTGLGLAITQRIIENHKGNITITNKTGIGTRILIKI